MSVSPDGLSAVALVYFRRVMITWFTKFPHVALVLSSLHYLLVMNSTLVLTFNLLKGGAPCFLYTLVQNNTPACQFRSSSFVVSGMVIS